MCSWRFLCSVLLCLCLKAHPALQGPVGTRCSPVSGAPGCVCNYHGGTIDLRPIANEGGVPKYTGLSDSNGYAYEFNPCSKFSDGECSNVYVCQTYSAGVGDGKVSIATDPEQIWIGDDDIPYIYYPGPDSRETIVTLVCDHSQKEATVTTIGDSETYLYYEFTLKSSIACPSGGSIAGIAGIVIILLSLAGVAAYFVIGAVVLKFRSQKSGSDLIVNKIFWFALPGLVKEGCVFTFGPCIAFVRGKMGKKQGYSEQL